MKWGSWELRFQLRTIGTGLVNEKDMLWNVWQWKRYALERLARREKGVLRAAHTYTANIRECPPPPPRGGPTNALAMSSSHHLCCRWLFPYYPWYNFAINSSYHYKSARHAIKIKDLIWKWVSGPQSLKTTVIWTWNSDLISNQAPTFVHTFMAIFPNLCAWNEYRNMISLNCNILDVGPTLRCARWYSKRTLAFSMLSFVPTNMNGTTPSSSAWARSLSPVIFTLTTPDLSTISWITRPFLPMTLPAILTSNRLNPMYSFGK